jgi:monovalent cation:proton antiporter-2 (CPA2) family protein
MSETRYLVDILILLAAAVVAVPIFRRLGLSSILGFLAAGAAVGPWGFGFIDQVENIRHIAEFGVVFLLFLIGIEMKPSRLWVMRRMVFGLGTAQVVVTGLALTIIAMQFGFAGSTAIIIGFGLGLSSTAFGLQILTERSELNSSYGRFAFSILLLQDLAIVPLLMLVSFLANEQVPVGVAQLVVLEALLVIGAVFLFGRYLLNPFLHQVAVSRAAEVFTAAAVFAVLGIAWVTELFGLSMALGAFLAGLMLADSRYRHQVIADIQPFRGILLGLFFMGVGMSINFGLITELGWVIVPLVVGLLGTKALLLWGLCRLMRVEAVDSVRVALLLPQSGEFAFVLFGLATVSGLMAEELFQKLVLIVALTMALTPLSASLAARIGLRRASDEHPHHVDGAEHDAGARPVIVAGFGRVGRRVVHILAAGEIPYLGLDSDPDCVARARADGVEVFFGDASRLDVLKAAGAEQAAALVVTLDQPEAAERLVSAVRQRYPELPIYVRAADRGHGEKLRKAGATVVISEMLEVGLQLGGSLLRDQGVPPLRVFGVLQEIREQYYKSVDEKTDSGPCDG